MRGNSARYVSIVTMLALAPCAGGQSLNLERYNYRPGEKISLGFEAGSGFAENAWVGVIPSKAAHGSEHDNDQHDISYQYLHGRTSGTLVFSAPSKPGMYDFRMHDTDSNGREVAYITFVVVRSGGPALALTTSSVAVNEQITVEFEAAAGFATNAWVGIVPSEVAHGSESENDRHDLAYQYLRGQRSGTLTFRAPAQPGTYDFRMNDTDSDGSEVAYVTFEVTSGE